MIHDWTRDLLCTHQHGYENEITSLIQESGSKTVDSICTICKLCGQLSLANQNKMIQLQQLSDRTQNVQLGRDICQAFISGSDMFVDRTLLNGIKTLEDCEMNAQIPSDENISNGIVGDLPQNIELGMSALKILFLKCQEIQVEVDTSMKENSDDKPLQIYYLNYQRSISLVTQVQNMTDSALILMQSTLPLLKGGNKEWKKLLVCSQMIQKCSSKLLQSSDRDSNKRDSSDSNMSDISVLSDTQMEQLEYAVQEVKSSMTTLMNHAQRYHLLNPNTPIKCTPKMKLQPEVHL